MCTDTYLVDLHSVLGALDMLGKSMKEFRKKLSEYSDYFYGIYTLLLGVLVSGGFYSEDKAYKLVFCICIVLWLVKMAVTNYSIKEIAAILVLFFLLGMTFITNRDKTLILALLAITGAKNVDLKRVFKWSFWAKLVVTIELILLAYGDFITNAVVTNKKSGKWIDTVCLGYGNPNLGFLNILMIFMLAIMAYGELVKWYIYLIMTGIIYGAYRVFNCRTGFIVWICFVLVMCIYRLIRKFKVGQVLLYLLSLAPIGLCALTGLLLFMHKKQMGIAIRIDNILHNRISLISKGPIKELDLFGCKERVYFDNGFYHLLYNYGIIMAIIFVVAYTYLMFRLAKEKMYNEVMVLFGGALVVFMEFFSAFSVGLNYSLILLSIVLYGNVDVLRGKEYVKEGN